MTGETAYERVRILLHDKGLGYVVPNPFWKDEEIQAHMQSALETLYALLLDRQEITGKPSVTCARMLAAAIATAGTAVPRDFYRLVIGRKNSGKYINADDMAIAAASSGFDAVYVAAGLFQGTAEYAIYYRKPVGPTTKTSPDKTDFPEGFYDTMITLACIELIKGEQQDAADRLVALETLFKEQLATL